MYDTELFKINWKITVSNTPSVTAPSVAFTPSCTQHHLRMARACGAAPLSWERVPSVAVEELGDSMGLMMLRSRVSTPLMRVFFTFVFPRGMAPLRPLTAANSNAHSASSFAFFSDFQSPALECLSLFSSKSWHTVSRAKNCAITHVPLINPAPTLPALHLSSRAGDECYCSSWVSTPRNAFSI